MECNQNSQPYSTMNQYRIYAQIPGDCRLGSARHVGDGDERRRDADAEPLICWLEAFNWG